MNRMSWRDYSGWTRAIALALLAVLLVMMLLVATTGFRGQLWFVLLAFEMPLALAYAALAWRDYRRKFGAWPRPDTSRLRDPTWIALYLLGGALGVILYRLTHR